MIKILYLGNKFGKHKKVKSVLETLEPLFAEFSHIKTASYQQNIILRFLDMLYYFIRYGITANKIIIDVYSTLAFNFAFILSLLSILLNKKYILFLHGGNLPERYQQDPQRVRFIFSRAYKIIAPSHYLAHFFQSEGFHIEVIPNIISLKDYTFRERKYIQPKLLAIRGFGKPYNPLLTLKAINILKDRLADIKLTMLGNKDEYYYQEVIEYIEQNSLQAIVDIMPKMPREKWITLSSNYDIMISNPIVDNTPVSLIEGMALGMCVISTKVGGVPYLVSDKEVVMIDSDQPQQLSDAILGLLNNPELAHNLSINGRKKAEEFDWLCVKKQWINILLS
jgi:glycosyltransferase involved in cell wall biosynthesis